MEALDLAAFLLAAHGGLIGAVCVDAATISDILAAEYGERAVMISESKGHQVALFASPSGTWSLLMMDGSRACFLGAGEKLEWIMPQPSGQAL